MVWHQFGTKPFPKAMMIGHQWDIVWTMLNEHSVIYQENDPKIVSGITTILLIQGQLGSSQSIGKKIVYITTRS